MNDIDLEIVRCPKSHKSLTFKGSKDNSLFSDGELVTEGEEFRWNVEKGMPCFFRRSDITGNDKMMTYAYDMFAGLHDFGVKYFLPIQQFITESELRRRYVSEMELEDLPKDQETLRILEIGVGTGANLAPIFDRLRGYKKIEYWGGDISTGMLRRCESHLQLMDDISQVKLCLADAHHLPFKDNSFDRVFHVGGIGGFNHPGLAISEMIRVAKPDTPIIIVDEQLDSQIKNFYQKTMFKLLCWGNVINDAPIDYLPEDIDYHCKQISDFYYCLKFRKQA